MARLLIFKVLFVSSFLLPPLAGFALPMKKEKIRDISYIRNNFVLLSDTARYQRQDTKKDKSKEKPESKPQPDKPDIREVPKARNQGRPPIVVKPNVKVKPIKVIRPNIKRP